MKIEPKDALVVRCPPAVLSQGKSASSAPACQDRTTQQSTLDRLLRLANHLSGPEVEDSLAEGLKIHPFLCPDVSVFDQTDRLLVGSIG